jgi:hypothetical protein
LNQLGFLSTTRQWTPQAATKGKKSKVFRARAALSGDFAPEAAFG